jgi:CelD/BcsL family acetyltransferase involved in cellulose biosynthesis
VKEAVEGAPELEGAIARGGPDEFGAVADEWRRLCDEPGNSLLFSRPEWIDAYFRGNTGTWVLCTLRSGGRLVAALPLIERKLRLSRLPATILRAPSDFNLWPWDIAVSPGVDRTSTALALWGLVRRASGWDVLELPNVPQGGFTEELFAAAAGDGFPRHRWEYMHSPYLSLAGKSGVQDPIQLARSAKLRASLRKALRTIEQEGGMRTVIDTCARREALDRLYELENLGWKAREGNPITARAKDVAFFDAIARFGEQQGYLHMVSLVMHERVVAVSIGFIYKSNHYGIKMGWDDNLKNLSLGHVLISETLRDCLSRGVENLHMGGLRSAWKEQWTSLVVPHATHYVFRNSLYGRILRRAKLRELAALVSSFPQNRGCLEGSPAKTASVSGAPGHP